MYSIQPTWLKYVLAINPMNAAIELFRSPLTGDTPDLLIIGIGFLSTFIFLILGIYYFRKTESYFADLS